MAENTNIGDASPEDQSDADLRLAAIVDTALTQESENMEVHHHPDLEHKPKRLREYLLEFLMIFLAVSMGFIAENYRESRINKEKERNYIENLTRDLKGDSDRIAAVIAENEHMMKAIDTLVKIRALDFTEKANNDLFFKLFADSRMYAPGIFKPNEVTLTQIKSTGGLNIIRPGMANLIAELDSSNQGIIWGEKFPYTHGEETFRLIYELTDYPALWTPQGELASNLPPLFTDDKKKLLKFFNLSADLMYTIEGYNNNLKRHLELLARITKALKDEYDLEEETHPA
jgi:hypothetical protein